MESYERETFFHDLRYYSALIMFSLRFQSVFSVIGKDLPNWRYTGSKR